MEDIMVNAKPYIDTIVNALFGLVAIVIIGAINVIKVKAKAYYEAKTTTEDRDKLHKIGAEAFAWAETIYKTYEGDRKLSEAYTYASEKLAALGISVTGDEIRASIEKAYIDYKAKKAGGKIAS
ncbi:phage holin, LLH family [Paenibacillus sp. FSL R5-0519]|jgi:hypothetical protein|uniref:phage holin, LLH family n=1 Tax=Paenibacillus TaxID=44249 RepID=UPI0030DA0A73